MKTLISLTLLFFPSFLQVPIRRLLGQRIGKGSKIHIGTFFTATEVNIGQGVSIGPFCLVRSQKIQIGNHSSIKPFCGVSTRVIQIGSYVHIAPLSIISSEFTENSTLVVGDHSRIFPFCWLDTGEGIFIGKNVGVGGHSLIFTHGVWADYMDGGPITYGPVTLHDNVWLPWRVFVLPNVQIGKNTIVGANSLVNKEFPENVLIGGSPAKILKENISPEISAEEKRLRAHEILQEFAKYMAFKQSLSPRMEAGQLIFEDTKIILDDSGLAKPGDLLFLVNTTLLPSDLETLYQNHISVLNHSEKQATLVKKNAIHTQFISYLRRYGIRLYINQKTYL